MIRDKKINNILVFICFLFGLMYYFCWLCFSEILTVKFVNPTPQNNTIFTNQTYFSVNISIKGNSSRYSCFIDFDNTLIAYWPFNSINTSQNTTEDFSSYNIDLTLGDINSSNSDNYTIAKLVEGVFDKAIEFDGVDDYAHVLSRVKPIDYETTIEAWINPKAYPNDRLAIIVLIGDLSGGISLALNSTGHLWYFIHNEIQGWRKTNVTIPLNNWTHIAFVYKSNRTKGYVKIYINGKKVYEKMESGRLYIDWNDGISVGGIKNKNWIKKFKIGTFNGTIDELKLYGRALSENEIKATINCTSYLFTTFTKIKDGTHYYQGFVVDANGDFNSTEKRIIIFDTFDVLGGFTNASLAKSSNDTMFLVKPGETIYFNVSVRHVENISVYIWEVNKVIQNTTNKSRFIFTVPNLNCSKDPSLCIWEIHVTVKDNIGNEGHYEWVISSLNKSQAPDFFEFFTDKKLRNRTEKDPWGRSLIEWWVRDPEFILVDEGFIETIKRTSINTLSNITQGTWIFRYRFPEGTTGAWGFEFFYIGDYAYYSKESDTHHHCGILVNRSIYTFFSIEYDGSGVNEDGKWHTVRIVRTKDGWIYMWRDNYFDTYVYDPRNITTLILKPTLGFRIAAHANDRAQIDDLMVWKGKELFPSKSIEYKDYIWNYYEGPNTYCYIPMYRKGIVVRGRNITLKDIYEAIKNKSLFDYDPINKTAKIYTNLVIDEGSELIIKNEKLLFVPKYDGELELVLKYGSTLKIINSTIDSANQYYWRWNPASSATHFGNELTLLTIPTCIGYKCRMLPPDFSCYCNLIIINSTINNTAHMFFDSPYGIKIINSKIQNLHEIDLGLYNVSGSYYTTVKTAREIVKGNKSFWIYTDELAVHTFDIKNITFGKEHTNIVFMINAHRDKLNIYDTNFGNNEVLIKYSATQVVGQSHTCYCDQAPYEWINSTYPGYLDSGIGFVNCKIKKLKIEPGIKYDYFLQPKEKYATIKYYMDVFVKDKRGNPIKNAKVCIKNELDNFKYPAENLVKKLKFVDYEYTCFYHIYRVIHGEPLNCTETLENGHTPLPNDKEHTIIVTDYKKFVGASFDGILLKWSLHHTYYWLFCIDVLDDLHGKVFHKCYKMSNYVLRYGNQHKVTVIYNKDNQTIRVILKNETNKVILDTGEIKIMAQIEPFKFNNIIFEVDRYRDYPYEISWDNIKKAIKIYVAAYRGRINAILDNMSLEIYGSSKYFIDYSQDPNLQNYKNNWTKYQAIPNTNKKSFVWKFDIKFNLARGDGPWVIIGLIDSNSEKFYPKPKIINYTYTVTAFKNTRCWSTILRNTENIIYPNGTICYSENHTFSGKITGIDPNESWYRVNPMIPSVTITVTLTNENEVDLFVNISNPIKLKLKKWNPPSIIEFGTEPIIQNDSNEVIFTVCSLRPKTKYIIKKDKSIIGTKITNKSGCLTFKTSMLKFHNFTIKKYKKLRDTVYEYYTFIKIKVSKLLNKIKNIKEKLLVELTNLSNTIKLINNSKINTNFAHILIELKKINLTINEINNKSWKEYNYSMIKILNKSYYDILDLINKTNKLEQQINEYCNSIYKKFKNLTILKEIILKELSNLSQYTLSNVTLFKKYLILLNDYKTLNATINELYNNSNLLCYYNYTIILNESYHDLNNLKVEIQQFKSEISRYLTQNITKNNSTIQKKILLLRFIL